MTNVARRRHAEWAAVQQQEGGSGWRQRDKRARRRERPPWEVVVRMEDGEDEDVARGGGGPINPWSARVRAPPDARHVRTVVATVNKPGRNAFAASPPR